MHEGKHSHRARDLHQSADGSTSTRKSRTLVPGAEQERAFLVSVLVPHTRADLSDPLGELRALAESAGTVVLDGLIQKRTSLSAACALGKGKLEELAQRADDAEVDVIIFDNDLTPRQIRGLERVVNRKVIDRSELILDIFALRAKTREAQLQVELAQLQYTAPRLRGLWTHLERIAGAGGATAAGAVGGVGTRGPGERQVEIDRRLVKRRIGFLKKEIDKIDRRKQREVRSRGDEFTVALVGYTNSGKTTLLNRLTNSHRYVADQLFATLDTKTARWNVAEGKTILLSDTVGFVRDLPHKLVASFRATLEETLHADLLLHVVDISARTAWMQMQSVESVLTSLECNSLPQILVLNKVDIADDASAVEMLANHRADVAQVSALTGQGLDDLAAQVAERMESDTVRATVRIPVDQGKLLSDIGVWAEVHDKRYIEELVELDISMSKAPFMQLRARNDALHVVRIKESGQDADPMDSSA